VLGVEAWTTIRYLQAQGVGIRAICRQLGVSRTAVRHALRSDGPPHYQRPGRPNRQLVPFEAQIHAWYFGQHLIGSRILRELRKLGYTGGRTALYTYMKQLRAAVPSARATVRFETPPGRQGQFDWSPYTVDLGGELTRVIVFGLTLGYSRRKHYTVSLDETQASIFEAIEACLHHFEGAPKELLVDNARALVSDASPTRFRWNPQFLELCGHYRLQPRACQPYRAQTKGKIERPFFYLEEQFIKGGSFASLLDLQFQLARFEAEDLDVYVHATTQERPIDRFQVEVPHLTALPEQRFVGTLALSRKVSWDCLVAFRGSRYSVPAVYAGKRVWLRVSRGTHLLVLDAQRQIVAEHTLSARHGTTVLIQEHYATLRRTSARTTVVLAEQFLARFPRQRSFLEGLIAQHKLNPANQLRPILELADVYDASSLAHAFVTAISYNTYSHTFVRGILEQEGTTTHNVASVPPIGPGGGSGVLGIAPPLVRADLGVYQRVLEAVG
jgi:transposase